MPDYIFIPKISSKPNKIVLFNEVSYYGKIYKKPDDRVLSQEKKTVERKFHGFKISAAAQKNLVDKVHWLYNLAKSRYVKTYNGKEIFNFKINFVTLTLPSTQVHPTSQITNECFNQFLTEIRQRTKLENYVWRLEFQQNGNVHYHIISDTYLDYFFVQKIWNRIINKLGYVDAFQKKMQGLTLNSYFSKYGAGNLDLFPNFAKRYAKGVSEKWSNPPSVDVKNCTSEKHIGSYISKYFSKSKDNNPVQNSLDNEENSFGLRLWFCSRSLSKLKGIVDYVEAMDFRPDVLVNFAVGCRTFYHRYATVFYINLNKMSNYVKGLLYPYFRNYASSLGYVSSS